VIRGALVLVLVLLAAWAGATVGEQHGQDTVRSYLGPADYACTSLGEAGAECWQIPTG
jgi:hypothetical protein